MRTAESWEEPVGAPVFEERRKKPVLKTRRARMPDDASVIMVLPSQDRFSAILDRRLRSPQGRCYLVHKCADALPLLGDAPPELVILEDRTDDDDRFLSELKVERGGALVSVLKVYPNRARVAGGGPMKIWEDDFLVQPFEMMELFLLAEKHLREAHAARRRGARALHFDFESSAEQQERAVTLLGSVLAQVGVGPDDASEFQAAFREAVDNGIRHGNRDQQHLRMDVRCLVTPERVRVRVADKGEGFDFALYLERAKAGRAEDSARLRRAEGGAGGLGIMLMWRCSDAMHYEGNGSVVVLEKETPQAAPAGETG
jgi:anti-sigma regulatory factor (Ser/Thr protein kinase)